MMKKHIYVSWAKSNNIDVFNFGDDIGPYIVGKLSGLEVRHIAFPSNRFKSIIDYMRTIIRGKISYNMLINFIKSFFVKEYILTCGSILQWYSSSRAIVWGSGIIDSKNELLPAKKYLAVRGKYSHEKIEKFNLNKSIVYGDPALLISRIYEPKVQIKYRLGVIAHYIHNEYFEKLNLPDDVLLIKLDSSKTEKIIDDICSCQYTISTSLHGVIVSHSYKIKSLWYKIEEKPLFGDNIKFLDYFSSVNIPEYKPFPFVFEDEFSLEKNINNLVNNEDINLPNLDLKLVQDKLLDCAPFKIKNIYR